MSNAAFYSEFDPGAAEWLRELIAAGLIPAGDVDERSITEVSADDLRGYRSVHLFAGIGGWPHALRLAGWPDDRPVWTGSCPCQPYSAAGKGKGDADERNLWPHMFRLLRECRPDVCFGEQVEGAIRHGWLDGVCRDLEGEGYAVGTAVLGAHSVGAPHIRQRLFWVADAATERSGEPGEFREPEAKRIREVPWKRNRDRVAGSGRTTGGLADADGRQPGDGGLQPGREHGQQPQDGGTGRGVGDADEPGREGRSVRDGGRADERTARPAGGPPAGRFWDAFDLIPCRDGKSRRTQPGLFPLAHGVSGRVGLLRGAGNAIVPQVAAEFIKAYIEARALT